MTECFAWQDEATKDEVNVTILCAHPEDPEQRKAFLLEDLSKQQQAEAKPSNTTASAWKEASWSETHAREDAKATFKALDKDGDGNCHILFHLSPKLCHLLFLVSRSCRHDHLSIEHLHQDHLNLLDETCRRAE